MSSIVTVVTPAPNQLLVALADVKSELSIRPNDKSRDSSLNRWIAQASAACIRYCRRPLIAETVTEEFDFGFHHHAVRDLVLDRKPVSAVTSVVEGQDAEPLVLGTDFILDAKNGVLRRMSLGFPGRFDYWYGQGGPYGSNLSGPSWIIPKIVVAYTGGFVDLAAVDPDVQRACMRLVTAYFAGAGRDPAVRRTEIPDVEWVEYFPETPGALSALPLDVREALNPWKKVF